MAQPSGSSRLKLRATDREDLAVVAACLQDALVPIGDMTYLADEHRFILVANRFRWEADPASGAAAEPDADDARLGEDASYHDAATTVFERTNCAIRVDRVAAVRTRGIDLRNRGQILALLTLHYEGGRLSLVFAGGATIMLEVEELNCAVEDIGEPWPTQRRPSHPAVSGEGPGE